MSPQTPDASLPENTTEDTGAATHAWGHGLATVADDGTVLDTWFPAPALGEQPDSDAEAPAALAALARSHPERRVRTEVVTVSIELDTPPADASDAYLRLHLLSHRLVRPHGVSTEGIFGKLAERSAAPGARLQGGPTARLRED